MYEKFTNISKDTDFNGIRDPILRDYLRVSGSPMVTSNRSWSNGLRITKKVRRHIQQGKLVPMLYIHRILYSMAVLGFASVVAAVWG